MLSVFFFLKQVLMYCVAQASLKLTHYVQDDCRLLILFNVMSGIKFRASYMLDKHSTS